MSKQSHSETYLLLTFSYITTQSGHSLFWSILHLSAQILSCDIVKSLYDELKMKMFKRDTENYKAEGSNKNEKWKIHVKIAKIVRSCASSFQ